MNKNKLIFAIIWAIVLIVIIFLALNLKQWSNQNTTKSSSLWSFNIWMMWSDKSKAKKVVESFKKLNPDYKDANIQVEAFSSYEDYNYALSSAILSGKWPDVFVLNNNEKNSIFSNQVLGINPDLINPNDFRKKYKWVFADDLILSTWEANEKIEFLAGVPVWYESLGIFFNRRYLKATDIESISSLNNKISDIKDRKPNIVPIAIGNWSTVPFVSDIVTQFFMLEDWVSWLKDIAWNKLKQWLTSYLLYWDTKWYNQFDSKFVELTNLWQNSIDLFSRWETFMVVWYPRMIEEIDSKWFSKSFLLASAFPHYFSGAGKTLVNYDYFVINKDTRQQKMAEDFLLYLSSNIWAQNYLESFAYYLPALLSLESDMLDSKIHPNYYVSLKDFYSTEHELSSFNKGIRELYDRNIIQILDNSANYQSSFEKFRSSILCKEIKISTLENLSVNCD